MNPIILCNNLFSDANNSISVSGATIDDSYAYYDGLESSETVFTATSSTVLIYVTTPTANASASDSIFLNGSFDNVTSFDILNSNASGNTGLTLTDKFYNSFTSMDSGSGSFFMFKFYITSGQTFSIKNIYLGAKISLSGLYSGFTPVYGYDNFKSKANIAKNGQLIGKRYELQARKFNLELKNLTVAWIEANLHSFLNSAIAETFYFAQDSTDINTFLFCWLDNSPNPSYQDTMYQQISIPINVGVQ